MSNGFTKSDVDPIIYFIVVNVEPTVMQNLLL